MNEYTAFGVQLPRAPGHEVIGKLVKKGSNVPDKYSVGKRYGRGWFGGCCFSCDNCRRGEFIACDTHQISGISDDGGYAEYIVCPWSSLASIPDNITSSEAAPLMCAGVTVFNGLRSMHLSPPSTVGIIGLGGLGHLAIQFASKMGYRTVAISSSSKKKEFAMKLGAHEYIDSSAGDLGKQLQALGGCSVILSTMDNTDVMTAAMGGLSTNGRLVVIGASMDAIKVVPGR